MEVMIIVAIIIYILYKYPIVLLFLGISVIVGIVIGVCRLITGKNTDISDSADYTDALFLDETVRNSHKGRCDGDCANCPPHYGYRYGRWYYGHDHVEGCQFGGNRCGGGMD